MTPEMRALRPASGYPADKRNIADLWGKRSVADVWGKRSVADVWGKRSIADLWGKRAAGSSNLRDYLSDVTNMLNEN